MNFKRVGNLVKSSRPNYVAPDVHFIILKILNRTFQHRVSLTRRAVVITAEKVLYEL